jgi:hypothetical protein
MSRARLDRATQVVLVVVTANVGRGGDSRAAIARVVAVFLRWLAGLSQGMVLIGWQEIDEADKPDEHGILHRTVRRLARGAALVGFRTAVPILCPKGWQIVPGQVWVDKISDGVRQWSPDRYLVGVLLEHESTGVRVIALNYHLARRRADLHAWEDGNQRVHELVENRYLPMGYPILATSDRNAAGAGRISPAKKATEANHGAGIDEIRVIFPRQDQLPQAARRRCASVSTGSRRTVRIGVDKHQAHGVEITLTAPKEHAA